MTVPVVIVLHTSSINLILTPAVCSGWAYFCRLDDLPRPGAIQRTSAVQASPSVSAWLWGIYMLQVVEVQLNCERRVKSLLFTLYGDKADLVFHKRQLFPATHYRRTCCKAFGHERSALQQRAVRARRSKVQLPALRGAGQRCYRQSMTARSLSARHGAQGCPSCA